MQKSIGPALAIVLAGLLSLLAPARANAAATCTINSSGVAFGVFSGSQLSSSGTITLHCTGTGTSNYNLKLSTGGSGTYSSRRMTGAGSLTYNLYLDSAHTQIWGDGTGTTSFPTGQIKLSPPPSVDISVNVFGLIPAQATPPSGAYSDSVVVTLTCTSGGSCTNTASVPITASVQPTCTISATNLNFGSYVRLTLNANTTLSATCSSGAAYDIGLNQGASTGATVSTRAMTGPGGALLKYSLFQDAARTINWGNTVGTDTKPATGTGVTQTFTVFGSVPASQSLAPGGYQDTITVTLYF